MSNRHMDPLDFEATHHAETERVAQQIAYNGRKLVYLLHLHNGWYRIVAVEPAASDCATFRPTTTR